MRKAWLGTVAALASATSLTAAAEGGPLLDFGHDLAFRRASVDAFAGRAYDERLDALRREHRLDRDPALRARLQRLLERLLPAAELERPGSSSLPWEIHTCRGCGENASSMAGGKLLFGEAFVAKLAPSDDELGFLLAHEMGHVLAQHTREFATAARYFVDNGLHRPYWDIQQEVDGSIGVQYRMAFIAREQELDADRIGFFLGARAGLDAPAMLSLLRKLGPMSASTPDSTHPSERARIDQAEAMLQAAEVVRGWAMKRAALAAASGAAAP